MSYTQRWPCLDPWSLPIYYVFLKYFFLYLAAPVIVAACKLSCSMWDLVLWPEIEPGPPAVGGQNLSHWTIREAPWICSVQFSSVAQSCPTLCDPMNRSTSGLPVHHQLPELTQTHVHQVSDAIQPSHPLSSPSLPAFNLSQHQGLFQWVSSSHQVAKILEFQLQHQSFQWTPKTDFL